MQVVIIWIVLDLTRSEKRIFKGIALLHWRGVFVHFGGIFADGKT